MTAAHTAGLARGPRLPRGARPVVQKPPPESELSCDTVLVHSRDDGLHIKIISQKEAESLMELMSCETAGLPC